MFMNFMYALSDCSFRMNFFERSQNIQRGGRVVKREFEITGMTCAACSARVDKSVSAVDGVLNVSVNLLKNSMNVEYDESRADDDKIIESVRKAGYGAKLRYKNVKSGSSGNVSAKDDGDYRVMKKRLVISFIFAVPLFYLAMGHMAGLPFPSFLSGVENAPVLALLQFILLVPILFANSGYFTRGFANMFRGAANMDSLIALGAGASTLYSLYSLFRMTYAAGHGQPDVIESFMHGLYFEGAGTILALITLGKFFEARAKGKTSDAINKLINLMPKTARVFVDGEEKMIPADKVAVGDILIVKSGETVPADGEIVDGNAAVDESAVTGESIPKDKQKGDKVTGATTLMSGYIVMRVLKVGDDTVLSNIIRLVDEATSSKAPIAKLADKVSGIFVPVVIAVAAVSAIAWMIAGKGVEFSLLTAVSVLVVSCPCALGLATPTAIMVGTGRSASYGILIKSAQALETAHATQVVVLDKTGTITEGTPVVTDIGPAHGVDERELLLTAASLERMSEHPLAHAIADKARKNGVVALEADRFVQIPGRGISAFVNGKQCYAGNALFMKELNVDISELEGTAQSHSDEGKTPLFFAREYSLLGIITVADVVKPTSRDAVRELGEMGIEVVMLTGDNAKTAGAIKKIVGIDRVVSDVLPQDKEKEVRRIMESGKKVAMVGDGINDAPALAAADIGIAIGAGTDIAIESADIVLMHSDLEDVPKTIRLSRATMRNIKQNLFWAFFYNSIGIPVAAGCFYAAFNLRMNPMIAALAMSFSSVFVVTNALRLRFFDPEKHRGTGKRFYGKNKKAKAESKSCNMTGGEIPETAVMKKNAACVRRGIQKGRSCAYAENDGISEISRSSGNSGIGSENLADSALNIVLRIYISGMMCENCVCHVREALAAVKKIRCEEISLESGYADIRLLSDVNTEYVKKAVKKAVTKAGYRVTEVKKFES